MISVERYDIFDTIAVILTSNDFEVIDRFIFEGYLMISNQILHKQATNNSKRKILWSISNLVCDSDRYYLQFMQTDGLTEIILKFM